MNPLRLNTVNLTRWLCERTMQSDKRMDEIVAQQEETEAKVDEIAIQLAEMRAQQQATIEKLDAILAR